MPEQQRKPASIAGQVTAVHTPIEQRYPWRVRCSGCGWVDHFDTETNAREWADRHNSKATSWPHDAKVSPR